MYRSLKCLIAVAVVVPALGAQRAEGQATPPDPAALLARAQTALNAAGSGHVNATIDEVITGKDTGHLTLAAVGDVKWKKPIAAQLTATITIELPGFPQPITQSLQVLDYKQQFAVKVPNQKWSCTALSKAGTSLGVAGSSTVPAGSNASYTYGTPLVLGPDVVNGTPVWHFQVKGTVTSKQQAKAKKGKKGKTITARQPFTANAYIDQATSTLVRIVSSSAATAKGDTVTVTESADLSNYGEPVTVTLPKACSAKKGKSSKSSAAVAGLVSSVMDRSNEVQS